MHFELDEERKKIENVIAGFEAFCISAVNVTYEQYRFNPYDPTVPNKGQLQWNLY